MRHGEDPPTARIVGPACEVREHYADRTRPYFAGSDAERAADLQRAIDDPSVRAILAFRGGYGSVRLLPLLDLTPLREDRSGSRDSATSPRCTSPCGASASRASTGRCPPPSASTTTRRRRPPRLRHSAAHSSASWSASTCRPPPLQHPRRGVGGRLAGGNLAVICAAAGTPRGASDRHPDGPLHRGGRRIPLPHRPHDAEPRTQRQAPHAAGRRRGPLHRHHGLRALRRGGSPARCWTPTCPLGIPVIYGFPAGHEDPNLSLYLGREVTVSVGTQGASLLFR